jgi:hypothetical protein
MVSERESKIKQFKGQVKIADVQNAFDTIVSDINKIIRIYNNQAYVADIDYTVAGSTLAPSGYTLTIGGMKQFLDAIDGIVLGAKVFRVNGRNVKITTGILVKNRNVYKLNDANLTAPSDNCTLYFNTNTRNYEFISGTNNIKICDISINRESQFVSHNNNIKCEDIEGTLEITIPAKSWSDGGFVAYASINNNGYYEPLDTSKAPKFLAPLICSEEKTHATLFNHTVLAHELGSDDGMRYWACMNYLYIPKGVSNPYRYYYNNTLNNGANNQKVFDVNISKDLQTGN